MAERLNRLSTEGVNPDTVNLDTASGEEFLQMMSRADAEAAHAVAGARAALGQALDVVSERMLRGGRLVYCGAGTSGRLGVLDASECPPTFGVDESLVVGVMAGGDRALRFSSESAEDHPEFGEADMRGVGLCEKDALVAIAASGRTPYCVGALRYARAVGAAAIALVCNENARMAEVAELCVTLKTGPEVLSGSTRLKAGTATKMALNALSTGVMVRLGKTYGNLMVDMKASNAKLRDRAVRMFQTASGTDDAAHAGEMLALADGSVKLALVMEKTGLCAQDAREALNRANGHARAAIENASGRRDLL